MYRSFGIVAEFNPFHNGHSALASFARASGATHIVAVMSGNAVQRGAFAVCDKRVRTKAALSSGIDLVLELPLPYAVSSAGKFAAGAIHILKSTGCVDAICFGSESGDIRTLEKTSRLTDAAELESLTRGFLNEGATFAKARQKAVETAYGSEAAGVLSSPNNILAIEYLREMRSQGWDAEAVTMKRAGAGHDSAYPSSKYASASYLRGRTADLGAFSGYAPPVAVDIYLEAQRNGLFPSDEGKLETAMLSRLRRLGIMDLKRLPDISEGIENRVYDAIRTQSSLNALLMAVKTKRYTLARIRRLLFYAFIGLGAADSASPPPYIRILGFNKKGCELLRRTKTSRALPVHTSLAKLEKLSPQCARLAELESICTDQFSLTLPSPLPCGYEYTSSAVIIK